VQEPNADPLQVGASGVFGGHERPRRPMQTSRIYELLPQRAMALLIDVLIWLALLVIAGVLFGTAVPAVTPDGTVMQGGVAFRLGPLQVYLVSCLWFGYMITAESRFGATLGKRALGLRVVRSDESRAGVGSIVRRHALRFVFFTLMSLGSVQLLVPLIFVVEAIAARCTQRRQRFGDQSADTVVLHLRDLSARDGTLPSPMAAPAAGGTPLTQVAYAGFWQRAVAVVIDSLLLYAAYEVVASTGLVRSGFSSGTLQDGNTDAPGLLASLVPTIVSAGYFIVLNGRGATLGKRLTGIRVVDRSGNVPGLRRSAIRHIIPLAAALVWVGASLTVAVGDAEPLTGGLGPILIAFAGFQIVLIDGLSMLWSERRQAFHDRMAGTFVMQRASEAAIDGSGAAAIDASVAPVPSRVARGGIVAGLVIGFVLCAGLATLGYRAFQWGFDTLGDSVTASMTDTLRATASDVVDAQAGDSSTIQFREGEVTVSNAIEPDYVGWEATTTGAAVYGVEVSIDPEGIALGSGDGGVMYSGVPVVINGSIELTEIRGDGGSSGMSWTRRILSASSNPA
jgi:uncharacterized RDD family membrane protein YckC